MVEPLLQVKDLKTYFKTDEGLVKAVNGVSFDLYEGEVLGIVGESGSGKSVTSLSVMRLIPSPPGKIDPSSQILFRKNDKVLDLVKLNDSQIRSVRGADIAMIFQDPMTSLNPVLTIGRQITESIELHMKMTGRQARNRAVELLKLVGIPSADSRLDDYPHQFSGGMRQRVMIAMGLSCNPKLLIADEPTTALDVTIQAQILDLLKKLRREFDSSIMLITHDLGVVAGMADRIIVMYGGQIVETTNARELYANPRHPYTIGLLNSVPRLDEARKERLIPIRGLPPDMTNLPKGCPFLQRCDYAVPSVCNSSNPPLRDVPLTVRTDVGSEEAAAEASTARFIPQEHRSRCFWEISRATSVITPDNPRPAQLGANVSDETKALAQEVAAS